MMSTKKDQPKETPKAVEKLPEAQPSKELDQRPETLPGAPMSQAELNSMYGDLETGDITVPRLTVLQGLSPEVADGLGRPGNLFVKGLNQELGKELEIIPMMRSKSRIYWTPLSEGGGILCQAPDGQKGQGDPGIMCDQCELKEWADGQPPKCDVYENVILLVRGSEDLIPMALSGARTKLKAMRDLNTLFMSQLIKGRPLYMKSYIIKVVEKTNKTNLKYFSIKIVPGNNNQLLPDDEIQSAKRVFESIRGKTLNIVQDNEKNTEHELNPEL
jgi:hypothetical protein